MSDREMHPVIFTVDYQGEPGRRSFFLQARDQSDTLSFEVEKQQVSLLAEKLTEMMLLVDAADPVAENHAARDPALAAVWTEPEFRVGSIGLGYDQDEDVLSLVLESFVPEDPPETEDPAEEPASVTLYLRRDQVRAFILHANGIVSEGRPLCPLCGLPIDPAGHLCPASNGHHPH